jgi:hypothetical protein
MLFNVLPKPTRPIESHVSVPADTTLCHSNEYLAQILEAWHTPRINDAAHPALHFYTTSRFALHDVVVRLLHRTGAAHVVLSTYSLSDSAIHLFSRAEKKNLLLSFAVVMDHMRAQTIRFQSSRKHLPACTELYHCSMHAKVALIRNAEYAISVVMSANASNSSTIERGAIYTQPDVIQFDANELSHIISRATRFDHRTGQDAFSPS